MSLYKFKSKAGGDVIMLAQHGDALMQVLGRQASPKGIIEVADLPKAIALLSAIEDGDAAARALAPPEAAQPPQRAGAPVTLRDEPPVAVGLRQRAHPLLALLTASAAAKVPVVWGV